MAKPLKEPEIRPQLAFDETMRRALLVKPESKKAAKAKSAKRKK
jgi:hypothetical protein